MSTCLGLTANWLRLKWDAFTREEHGAGEIIAVVVILAVVIALGILFHEQIGNLFNQLWSTVTGQADDVNKENFKY